MSIELAKLQIEANMPLNVIKESIKVELLKQDRVKFDEAIKAEYDKLFPIYREMIDEEKLNYEKMFNVTTSNELPENFTFPKVEIDYSQDESYITEKQYKNETRIIQEAVEATEDTEAIPEVTELVRPYIPVEATDEMIQAELDKIPEYKEYVKAKIAKEKEEIKSVVNTVEYDGDFSSINYMSATVALVCFKCLQAISDGNSPKDAYTATFKEVCTWKGADNEPHDVQYESVAEALYESMKQVADKIGAK